MVMAFRKGAHESTVEKTKHINAGEILNFTKITTSFFSPIF